MQPFIKTGNLVIPETHQTAAQGGRQLIQIRHEFSKNKKKLEEIVSL